MHRFDYTNIEVLVIGGAGFIGSHLVEKLVALGAKVTVLDNLSTGSLDNLSSVISSITLIVGSITNRDICLQATYNKKTVFHLAAIASVPLCDQQPRQCEEINIDGTYNLLQASKASGVERFVFSSSSAVYGNAEQICNEDALCNPTSHYGYSKCMGELACQEFKQNGSLDTIVLRYFNVFGARQNGMGEHAGVVAKFNYLFKHNQPIELFAGGTQTRDFVPVEKVVEANLCMGILEKNPKKNVYNIASGKSMSIYELYHTLKQQYPNYTHEPIMGPKRESDILHSVADISAYEGVYSNHMSVRMQNEPQPISAKTQLT